MRSRRFLPAVLLFHLMPLRAAEASPFALVQVSAEGSGVVVPGGGSYEVGTRLTFTAQPGSGFVFRDWTDAAGVLLSPRENGSELEYLVTGDAQIVGHFAPSPFGGAAGNWMAGLRTFDFDSSGHPHGTVRGVASVALAASDIFSGTLSFDGENFALSGMFDAAGRASQVFPRIGRTSLRVALRLKLDGLGDQMNLAVYDGGVCAMASVSRREAAELEARYTVALEAAEGAGKGCALLTRMLNGTFDGAGALADETAFTFTTRPGHDHFAGAMALPVEARFGDGGSLSGQIVLENTALPPGDFSGKLQWVSPVQANAAPPKPPELAATTCMFVGPLGADTNDGTVEFPLATLDAALARIGGAGEIVLLPGSYEQASLNLATAQKVTLRSAPGHPASIFFGEKIMGSAFTHHQGNVWKAPIQTSVPVQGSENRWWIFEMGTPEAVIPPGSDLPQQRGRAARLDHFRIVQASSIGGGRCGQRTLFRRWKHALSAHLRRHAAAVQSGVSDSLANPRRQRGLRSRAAV